MFAKALQFTFMAVAALGVYGFVATARDGEARRACTPLCAVRPDYAARNRIAPDFELPALSGGTVKLSSLRGKSVILNFWTKTCRPCLEEMPAIADLAKALKPHPDIVLLTVTIDESAADVHDTMKSVLGGDPPFLVLIDADSKVVSAKYGTKLFPETWFIDPKGVIRARVDGARDWAKALTIDLAASFEGLIECPIHFDKRTPEGPAAGICGEIATVE
jgi:peroxiredoxin